MECLADVKLITVSSFLLLCTIKQNIISSEKKMQPLEMLVQFCGKYYCKKL